VASQPLVSLSRPAFGFGAELKEQLAAEALAATAGVNVDGVLADALVDAAV
jgi:hypothetical protein